MKFGIRTPSVKKSVYNKIYKHTSADSLKDIERY